ncbi:MAG TPA: IS66 family transposase [Dissulfurispiraceae bacterium]|nr:IS66 family transposase [Dissulfurispiraceae bacterium]
MKESIVELTAEEIDALIQRIETGTLTDNDLSAIKAIVKSYLKLTRALRQKTISVKKLMRMIFGASTEKAKTVLGKIASTAKALLSDTNDRKGCSKKHRGHGRNGVSAYSGAEKISVPHPAMKSADVCPECAKGKVYPSVEPGVFVRITGGAPLKSQVWEMQKLRCNLCGEIYAAPLPEEAGTEKYDETAGAIIPLLKYGSGLPFNRLEQLQESMGSPLPASTQWEITERTADRGPSAVYKELLRQGAHGHTIYNDDTIMKILSMINDNKEDDRSGIFTTGILSIVGDNKIVLFCTGRNHAGENITNLLAQRDPTMPPPIQMCDALSRNVPKEFETILANCLAHGRRNFVDVTESFPEECRYVIEALSEVYKNDKMAKEQNMTPSMRLKHHQENSGPGMKQLHDWMTEQMENRKAEPNSGIGKAISYMLKHWEPLTLFLRVEGAPLDNNICEQALKRAILHRKNSLFYKTLHGAQVGDIFMSLIHTCKLAKINPFHYLVELQRHMQDVIKRPQDWLPWNYIETLAAMPV